MMIRPEQRELEIIIGIALTTARTHLVREVFSPTRRFDRNGAVDTLTARVLQALGRYEISREAHEYEIAPERMLPLFPDE
jgi:hypothetical protein